MEKSLTQFDCKERVAFDLMVHIAKEIYDDNKKAAWKTKDYWLKLYRQCYKATSGHFQESILKEE